MNPPLNNPVNLHAYEELQIPPVQPVDNRIIEMQARLNNLERRFQQAVINRNQAITARAILQNRVNQLQELVQVLSTELVRARRETTPESVTQQYPH